MIIEWVFQGLGHLDIWKAAAVLDDDLRVAFQSSVAAPRVAVGCFIHHLVNAAGLQDPCGQQDIPETTGKAPT